MVYPVVQKIMPYMCGDEVAGNHIYWKIFKSYLLLSNGFTVRPLMFLYH